MDKKRSIHLLEDTEAAPGDAEADARLDEEIDRLLRMTADECSASVDFDAIKRRSMEAAKSKLTSKNRTKRAASYFLFACASLMLGFAVLTALKGVKRGSGSTTPKIDVMNTASAVKSQPTEATEYAYSVPETTPVATKGSPSDPIIKIEPSPDESQEPVKLDMSVETVAELFPDNLPDTMEKSVDEDGTFAYACGMDNDGEQISYECTAITEPPISLEIGAASSVQEGDELVYYWQVSDDQCISVRFTGFGEEDADLMFFSLAERIKSIESIEHSSDEKTE